MPIIECVPNISEGRRHSIVSRCADATRMPGVRLLDLSSDSSHNRTVLTLAGDGPALKTAIVALFQEAIATIDLRVHAGVHPRIGAVDVVPFVPIEDATMDTCVALARETAEAVAARFGLPVYLYGSAAADPTRRNLEDVRRGQFEGLASRMTTPAWLPDFGPAQPHPSAGATIIGARPILVAYNVNLASDQLVVAKQIAAVIRTSGGGLPCVKAMGVTLADRGIVQVSMNLTDHTTTSMSRVFHAIRQEAARYDVSILESEIVGLAPAAALAGATADDLQLAETSRRRILETRLREHGFTSVA